VISVSWKLLLYYQKKRKSTAKCAFFYAIQLAITVAEHYLILMKYLSRLFLFIYRLSVRLSCKCFSFLISGAFASFGKKTTLMYPLRLSGERRIAIGDRVFIGSGSWLQTLPDDHNQSIAIRIGSGTSIAGACVISAVRSVVLEENVLLARNVYISDHIHKYTQANTPILAQGLDKISPVLIKRGAWLGQNVVVCPGVTIGQGAVIGANAVVTRNIPDFSVAVGVPARGAKTMEVVV
jgi:carbonic anhydrase/acetyltransferase-like protein (isoleucine patch superfamily)